MKNMLSVLKRIVPRLSSPIHVRCIGSTMTTHSANNTEKSAKRQRLQLEREWKDRLVWVDLEMSGLDVSKEHILEMACLVTDEDLNIVAEAPDLIIHQSDEVLDNMGEWCQKTHDKSGLTEAVRKSALSLADVEQKMLEFVEEHTLVRMSPLAGNTIHADKEFLQKYMPRFMAHLHYRIVDVSTIKELARRWYPAEYSLAPKKKFEHRALEDIKESIAELQYYRQFIFKATE